MQIEIYPYELHFNASSCRKGVLFRITFAEDLIGFSDCHPWPTLGDESLDEQLQKLREGTFTALTQRSFEIARTDAEARRKKVNLFQNLTIPPSHWLTTDLLHWSPDKIEQTIQQGFNRYKIKLGKNLPYETEELRKFLTLLPDPHLVRLDFNKALNRSQFEFFLQSNQDLLNRIDFFEDPFDFEPHSWENLQRTFAIQLASDLDSVRALKYPQSASVCVIKPAVQNIETFLSSKNETQKWVITTYLDHPLGVLNAAYTAAYAAKKEPKKVMTCGLLSHFSYKQDSFSSALNNWGPYLIPPSGIGFGFDELLANLSWKNLSI